MAIQKKANKTKQEEREGMKVFHQDGEKSLFPTEQNNQRHEVDEEKDHMWRIIKGSCILLNKMEYEFWEARERWRQTEKRDREGTARLIWKMWGDCGFCSQRQRNLNK